MKILNLYAGIGGNRKLWENVEVTAVELDKSIAAVYQEFFPDDTVIVADAHQYLLEHYNDGWGFIWSSPPCPSHSEIRRCGTVRGQYPAVYPDIKLWEEITLLKHHHKKPWVIENVKPYYKPIIEPEFILDRHYFWSNFFAPFMDFSKRDVVHCHIQGNKEVFGFNIKDKKLNKRKDQVLRNMVNPEVGKYILDCAVKSIRNETQCELFVAE